MLYIVTHQGREFRIDVRPDDAGRFRVAVDDRVYEADLGSAGGKSLFSLLLGNDAYEVSVVHGHDAVHVGVRGHDLALRVESEQARNARLVEGAKGATGPHTVKSVMPGRVVRVLVSEGDEVQPGTALLILEAMKMENEIRSVSAGRIARILVSDGQTVVNGDALVTIS